MGISRCSGAEILKHLLKFSIVSVLLVTDKVMGVAIRAGCVDVGIGQMSAFQNRFVLCVQCTRTVEPLLKDNPEIRTPGHLFESHLYLNTVVFL